MFPESGSNTRQHSGCILDFESEVPLGDCFLEGEHPSRREPDSRSYLGVGEEFPGCNNNVAKYGGRGRLSPSTRAGKE